MAERHSAASRSPVDREPSLSTYLCSHSRSHASLVPLLAPHRNWSHHLWSSPRARLHMTPSSMASEGVHSFGTTLKSRPKSFQAAQQREKCTSRSPAPTGEHSRC